MHLLGHHDSKGSDVLSYAISKGSQKCAKLILNDCKEHEGQEAVYKLIAGDGGTKNAFTSVVAIKDKQFLLFLLDFLSDEQKALALHSVVGMDRDLTWVPPIVAAIDQSSKAKVLR